MENGIALGKADGIFAPDDICACKDILNFIYRWRGSPDVAGSLEGVPADADYAKAAAWAVENGLVSAAFDPEASIDRASTVEYLYNLLA